MKTEQKWLKITFYFRSKIFQWLYVIHARFWDVALSACACGSAEY